MKNLNDVSVNKRRLILVSLALIITFPIFRIFLYLWPNVNLDVGSYNIHHLFTGVLLIMIGGLPLAILNGKNRILDIAAILFGSGLSMALDQWVYLIVTDGSDSAYLLPISFWGGLAMESFAMIYILLMAYFFRGK